MTARAAVKRRVATLDETLDDTRYAEISCFEQLNGDPHAAAVTARKRSACSTSRCRTTLMTRHCNCSADFS